MNTLGEKKVLVLIPARYGSSRFPGKPLAVIKNKTMIQRVFENSQKAGFDTFVITDDQRIEDHVLAFGGQVKRVNDDVPTGSERMALAYERFFQNKRYDFIVNVQGDEPLLKSETIRDLVTFHLKNEYSITTILRKRFRDVLSKNEEDFNNSNIVKAAFVPSTGQCLYFSRSPIPFERIDSQTTSNDVEVHTKREWFQHIGVYCYREEALLRFVHLPLGELEKREKLEQLRALENKMSIGAITTEDVFVGVDVLEDIKKVENYL